MPALFRARPPCLSSELESLSLAELELRRSAALATLLACTSAEEAKNWYNEGFAPLEREAVFRAPLGHTPLLFVTVGGQPNAPTLACLAWDADHIVFLHSEPVGQELGTLGKAMEVVAGLGRSEGTFELCPIGSGKDPLPLYAALKARWLARGCPRDAVVDLTGGYKTMSAAAGAAGFALPGVRVAYIDTEQPPSNRTHGLTFWYNTKAGVLANPFAVMGDLARPTAERLFVSGRFGPAAVAWRELSDRTAFRSDEWRADLAEALDLADRMDFSASAKKLTRLLENIPKHVLGVPALRDDPLAEAGFRRWAEARIAGLTAIHKLTAAGGGSGDPTKNADQVKDPAFLDFIQMLLEMAGRRAEAGEYDVAALFAYRAMEALPQRRLSSHGYSVDAFDWERLLAIAPELRDYRLRRILSLTTVEPLPAPRATVDRGVSMRILAECFPNDLIDRGRLERLDGISNARNKSVLAHGLGRINEESVKKLIRETSALFERLLGLEDVSEGDRVRLRARHSALPGEMVGPHV